MTQEKEMVNTGILFQLTGKRTDTDIDELWLAAKKEIVAKMDFPFTVTMSCGRSVIFDDAEHLMGIGNENIKCKCGNPTHYMVRFIDERQEVTDDILPDDGTVVKFGQKPIGGVVKVRKGKVVTIHQTRIARKVNDDSDSGAGQPDSPGGSSGTGKPKLAKKPKAKRAPRKRAKKVL